MTRTSAARKPGLARLSLRALARAMSWHRRKLAVLAAVAAVLTGISAALPPASPTVQVVSVKTRLAGGTVLSRGDLMVIRVPPDVVPDGVLVDVDTAVGKTVSAPIPRGQLLTELSVVSASRGVRVGFVVAPLRLADADVAALLGVGDPVDVVAADAESRSAVVVARGVRVVGLPRAPDESGLGGSIGASTGALVLIEVDSKTATALAQAAVTSTLSIVLH